MEEEEPFDWGAEVSTVESTLDPAAELLADAINWLNKGCVAAALERIEDAVHDIASRHEVYPTNV